MERLAKQVEFGFWEAYDDTHTIIRFATSWAIRPEGAEALSYILSLIHISIGTLLTRRHYYFVPFSQDNAAKKPRSMVAHFELLPETIAAALEGRQLQPLLA